MLCLEFGEVLYSRHRLGPTIIWKGIRYRHVSYSQANRNFRQLTQNTSGVWWGDGLQATSATNLIHLARDYDQ